MNASRLIRATEEQIQALLNRAGSTPAASAPKPGAASSEEPPTNHGAVLFQAADHCSSASGAKRARPRLVAAFGAAVDADEEALVRVAVAGELIHAASLVHDDVIDEGTLRRGRPTVNAVWNNLTAVLTGDLMFSLAFLELAEAPRVVMNAAADVLREMSCAAIDEANGRGDLDLPLSRWSSIAEGKTGALFGWCGASAAHVADNEEAARRFDACGRRLGVAFQLADDLKDLQAPGGKDRFQDIKNQNPSFPLLWAMANDSVLRDAFVEAWAKESMTDDEVQQLGERVLASKAIAAAEDALRRQVAGALDALGEFADTEGGQEILSWAAALSAPGAVVAFATRESTSAPQRRTQEGAA